jgi:hypothetical protein
LSGVWFRELRGKNWGEGCSNDDDDGGFIFLLTNNRAHFYRRFWSSRCGPYWNATI